MEAELWNRVNITRPSAISTTHITFGSATDSQVARLRKASEEVLGFLHSEVLQTEVRVLYALLYVLNNSLRQHLPFRAIKQVEQCINRLKDMNLDSVLLDLKEMCPSKAQRLLGKRTGQCEVPSQPTLEWMCLKVLGACKLMIRLADRCCQAFRLVGQHIHWGEFIVLNVVLLSMLSRLWTFSQGILRTLASMYEKMRALLQVVSQAKPMPFLTNFTLPADLEEFLGSVAKLKGDLCEAKGTRRPALLNRLFREEGRSRKRKQPCLNRKSSQASARVDLGTVVLQSRAEITGDPDGLDLKSLLKRPYAKNNLFGFEKHVQRELELPSQMMTSREVALIGQKRSFLKKLKALSTLSDVSAHLQALIDWCRSGKMRGEIGRLRLLQLKCQRLSRLEAQGHGMKRKLRRLKWVMSRAVCPGETRRPERALSLQNYRSRRCHSLHRQWRTLRCRTLSRSNRRLSQECARKGGQSQCPTGDRLSSEPEIAGDGNVSNEDAAGEEKDGSVVPDDIDDIFASIGF
ncbi:hypothetical protein GJAV_G00207670 [Gymnothorax javanicus]|nr:hypothetical protein GJAV_G00207670 [Gymnothorax javanicus]